jgi:hypothetical protein
MPVKSGAAFCAAAIMNGAVWLWVISALTRGRAVPIRQRAITEADVANDPIVMVVSMVK